MDSDQSVVNQEASLCEVRTPCRPWHRVYGLGLRAQGSGFRVEGLKVQVVLCRVEGLEVRGLGVGFCVGIGFKELVSGFRDSGLISGFGRMNHSLVRISGVRFLLVFRISGFGGTHFRVVLRVVVFRFRRYPTSGSVSGFRVTRHATHRGGALS